MKSILSFLPTLIASAAAVAACVDTSTSTCADGARCPTGHLCVEGPDGPDCIPAPRVHDCTEKNEAQPCRYDEMGSPALCRAGICTLMECRNGYVDWDEVCDDGNDMDGDGCSPDCQRLCGDGIVQYEDGELCDRRAPLPEPCLGHGFDMGTLVCDSSCQGVSTMSCTDFDWQPMPTAHDDWHFARVWVFSPEQAVAVATRGASPQSIEELLCADCGGIFEYKNEFWHLRKHDIPPLLDLWANGPEDIYAVGILGSVWHYDGDAWIPTFLEPDYQLIDPAYQLIAIWGTGPDNLFAVGAQWHSGEPVITSRFAILRHDGNAWTPMVLPEDAETSLWSAHALLGIWGSGTDNVFAVGSHRTILHYDGNPEGIWRRMDVPPSSGGDDVFLDVWGTDATDVTVVGHQGTILRFDGHKWSRMDSPTQQNLSGIWGSPEGQMIAVGAQGALLGYEPMAGAEWRMMPSDTSSDLLAIHGSSADSVLAVGTHGTVVRRGENAWTAMDLQGNERTVNQIWGSGLDCMYAVDVGGQIWRYDGNARWRWAPVSSTESGSPWHDVHGLECDEEIFAVGLARPALRYHDGTWMEMQGIENFDVNAVWVAGPDDVFAVGHSGRIWHYNGNPDLRWQPMYSGFDGMLSSLWGTSPSNVFAVGKDGTILHYDGNLWARMDTGAEWLLHDVWGAGPDDVFAVGEAILHYDGTDWSSMAIPAMTGTLQAVWGSSADRVFAAGKNGVLLHYDGANWSPMRSPTEVQISSIWGTPDGQHIFVGDILGRIFRLKLPPAALPAD